MQMEIPPEEQLVTERPPSPYDEDIIPKQFIDAEKARDETAHTIEVSGLQIPVEFITDEEGRYGLRGIEETTGDGIIISGRIACEQAKINHLNIGEKLRDSGGEFKGVANRVLADTELELKKRGVETIYAGFLNPSSVVFFTKNGYEVRPFSTLTEKQQLALGLNPQDFDARIGSINDFDALKDRQDPHKILLVKKLQ